MPAVFQYLINDALWNMLEKCIIEYVSDVLIYSSDQDMHVQHIKKVVSQLLKHQLYVKGETYGFHVQQVAFLGYIIGLDRCSRPRPKAQQSLTGQSPPQSKNCSVFWAYPTFTNSKEGLVS